MAWAQQHAGLWLRWRLSRLESCRSELQYHDDDDGDGGLVVVGHRAAGPVTDRRPCEAQGACGPACTCGASFAVAWLGLDANGAALERTSVLLIFSTHKKGQAGPWLF